MPVCCAVCKSSFKDRHALQMHKTAKGHSSESAVRKASGGPNRKNYSQTKSDISQTALPSAIKVESSGSSNFRCDLCCRSFSSQGALATHTKAKNHTITNGAKLNMLENSVFFCYFCGRRDFDNHDALDNHKCDSKDHPTRNQESVPLGLPAGIGKEADHKSRPGDGHASTLSVDKAVQCNLCSCNPSMKITHESRLVTNALDGDKQQNFSQSNGGNHRNPLIQGHSYYSGITKSCQDMSINPEERAMEATSQQSTLAKNSDNDGVPLARSSILISQASVTEDPKAQHPPTLQLQSSLANVPGSMGHGQLKHLGKEWSTISLFEQPLALKVLRDLCHPLSDLEENGYRLRQYTFIDLLGWQRCKRCKKRQRDVQSHQTPCTASVKKNKRLIPNKEHPLSAQYASVRGNQLSEIVPSHAFAIMDGRKKNRYLQSSWTPEKDPLRPKCPAVALDCEMAEVIGADGLWREVIKVSAVDFLSGETLLDTLVLPTAKVKRWKTEITGITDQVMKEATVRGQSVRGWAEARSKLWQHIDGSTVLIGQSLHHDLEVLGMLHTQVVDSAILAAKTIDLPGAKTIGLKKMCKEILNVNVQCSNGGMHDCLEDVLASRELILHWIYNPEKLQRWALLKREEELEREARLQRQRERRRASASRQNTQKGKGTVTNVGDYGSKSFDIDDPGYSDDEVLRWEDIAEDLGWPHPDTGYDPWSD
ncbi:MAG: hypothetical protein Q9215_005816 [Flavoplaca cf. flavocitrina]